jgi:hypothetical protein
MSIKIQGIEETEKKLSTRNKTQRHRLKIPSSILLLSSLLILVEASPVNDDYKQSFVPYNTETPPWHYMAHNTMGHTAP